MRIFLQSLSILIKGNERFNKLIEKKFNNNVLIRLFDYFKNRSDKEIHKLVTDNADIPTIFEYILAITWYVISGKKGDVLEYMNLSLEADLLPKTHAGGGEADIVWKYEAEKCGNGTCFKTFRRLFIET